MRNRGSDKKGKEGGGGRGYLEKKENMIVGDNSMINNIQDCVVSHLESLTQELTRYFPEYSTDETDPIRRMIRNPFIVDVMTVPDDIQEELIELQNDTSCKDNFTGGNLEVFWCKKAYVILKFAIWQSDFLHSFQRLTYANRGFQMF
uniref:Uncharacterized protein n=2 Tax=Cacopsylla melanoneura TaxID=428564 RepID=A0A8D8Z4H1_9HEMI